MKINKLIVACVAVVVSLGSADNVHGVKYEGQTTSIIFKGMPIPVPHGKGTMKYENGCTYDGDWTNGQWNGKGTYRKASGFSMTGDWLNGELCKKCTICAPKMSDYDFEGEISGGLCRAKNCEISLWEQRLTDGKKFANTYTALVASLTNDHGIDSLGPNWNGKITVKYVDGSIYKVDIVNGKKRNEFMNDRLFERKMKAIEDFVSFAESLATWS